MIARQDDRHFPHAFGDDDLSFVLDRALVAGTPRNDIHLATIEPRAIAEVVLEHRPRALVQIGRLRDDVREIERERIVEAARRAIEGARQMATIDAIAGRGAGARVVRGRIAGEIGGQSRIEGEAVAPVFGTEVRRIDVVAHPVRLPAVAIVRRRVLQVPYDEVIGRIGVRRFTEFRVPRVARRSQLRHARRQRPRAGGAIAGGRAKHRRPSGERVDHTILVHAGDVRRLGRPGDRRRDGVAAGVQQRREELILESDRQRRVARKPPREADLARGARVARAEARRRGPIPPRRIFLQRIPDGLAVLGDTDVRGCHAGRRTIRRREHAFVRQELDDRRAVDQHQPVRRAVLETGRGDDDRPATGTLIDERAAQRERAVGDAAVAVV